MHGAVASDCTAAVTGPRKGVVSGDVRGVTGVEARPTWPDSAPQRRLARHGRGLTGQGRAGGASMAAAMMLAKRSLAGLRLVRVRM